MKTRLLKKLRAEGRNMVNSLVEELKKEKK